MNILSKFNCKADYNMREALLLLVEPNHNAKILEIGPGSNPDSIKAADIIRTSNLHGLEFPGQGEPAAKHGIAIRESDLRGKWPCENNEFDVVLSNQVLEHIGDTDHFFEELFRIIKPNGYAVISTPNLGSWVHIIMLILTIHPVHCWVSDKFCALGNPISSLRGKERHVPTPAHLRLYTLRALREMAEIYSFHVEKIDCGSFGLPFFDRWLCRIDPYHGIYAMVKMRKVVHKLY